MPTNNPISNIAFNTWLSPDQNNSSFEGLLLAQYLKGGYQTVTTLDDRDAIPIYDEGVIAAHEGFTSSGDEGKTTGRRSLGMMVHVIDPAGDGSILPKTYVLLPLGYFGNNDNLGWDSWSQLPEWEKAKRMKPSATVYTDQVAGGPPPVPVEYVLPEPQVEDDCWVELIQFTEHPLPPGGFAGQVLSKFNDDDYSVGWISIPAGEAGSPGASVNFSTQYDGPHDIQESRIPNDPTFPAMTVDGGLSFTGGEYITVQSDANPEYVQVGIVVDYTDNGDGTGSLVYNHVQATGGGPGYSGNEIWNINLSSAPGVTGDQGPQGEQGLTGNMTTTFIGNLWTHPLTPGANGTASGLAVDGPVEIAEGDMFSVIMPTDPDSSSSPLNGTFVAINSWTHPQTPDDTNAVTPIMDLLANYGLNFEPVVTSFPSELQDVANFTITVSANSKFEIDGVEQKELFLTKGKKYIFDVTGVDWATHPFLFSSTEDGTHNGGTIFGPLLTYNMIKYDETGIIAERIVLEVPSSWPDQLFYYCTNHSGMGGTVNLLGELSTLRSDVMQSSMIPDTNAAYDLGSAEYKIRHLFLSDNSVYFGDNNVPLNSTKVQNTLNFSVDETPPTGPNDPAGGLKGDIRFDLDYIYICVADGVWRRASLDNTWLP